jgi:hypothetical protein
MKITRRQLRQIIQEEISLRLIERKGRNKSASSKPNVGYHEDEQFHKLGVELDQDVFQVDAESAKTMAIDDALEGLREKGVDVSGGHRVLRTGFSDGVLVVGISK